MPVSSHANYRETAHESSAMLSFPPLGNFHAVRTNTCHNPEGCGFANLTSQIKLDRNHARSN
jgi:hypothetical protein